MRVAGDSFCSLIVDNSVSVDRCGLGQVGGGAAVLKVTHSWERVRSRGEEDVMKVADASSSAAPV